MMSETNEEVTEKYQNLFEGCNFRFKGLKSKIENAFVNLVEDLGAEVSDDAQVTFVQKCYFKVKENFKKHNLYDISYIMDSVQAGKALSLDNYRLVSQDNDEHPNDEPMCYAARYIYKTDSCHKCFYDKIFCVECAKQNKESTLPDNRHRIVTATDSSCKSEKEMSESPSLILRKKGRDNAKVMQHDSKSKKRIISSGSDHSDDEEQSTSIKKSLYKKRFKSSDRAVDQKKSSKTEMENERCRRESDSENNSNQENSVKPRNIVSDRNVMKTKELRNGNNCWYSLNKKSPKKVVESDIVSVSESSNDWSDAGPSKMKVVKKPRNEDCRSRFSKKSPKKLVEKNGVSEIDSDDDISDDESSKNKHIKVHRNRNSGNKFNKKSPMKVVERNIVRETDSDVDVSDSEYSKIKHVKRQSNGNNENKATKTVSANNIASRPESDDDLSDAETHKNKRIHEVAKKSSEWIKASTSKISPAKMKQHFEAWEDSDILMNTDDEEKLYFKEKKWWLQHEISKEEECRISCCSYEPGPHRSHWLPSRFMSFVEKKIMVKYFIMTNSIEKAKGKNVFENMRKDGYLTHRSAETLRNCFRRTIVKEVKSYGLPTEIYKSFARLKPRPRRKMILKYEENEEEDDAY